MRLRIGSLSLLAALAAILGSPLLEAARAPLRLGISVAGDGQASVSWPDDGSKAVLERSERLGPRAEWQPVSQVPHLQNGQFSVPLTAAPETAFFRLRTPNLVTVAESSPMNGETGVAVTRETIIRFSAPLASSTLLGTNHFYAGYGGRRILSRVELSSDRTRATLFYLEPLPGHTRVYAVFDGTGVADELGQPIDADGDGQPGGSALIAFDTLGLTPLAGTAVIGRVFASELVPGPDTGTNAVNKPLAGVTITVDGMEQTLRAVTDATGSFTLSPVPAGRFFVHIDGRTASNPAAGIRYPDQSYYPFVGKAWEAVAGKTDNLAGGTGEIFLPLIVAGSLQPVSIIQDTPISFPPSVVANNPALAGVSITVPANALFSDNGTRGGKVGLAPVPPDRLPGPLPPGLELPLVITVQTDGGLNFDRPAPICFPNLPDPILKAPLPAGSKQALISFDHDKGIWEAVGSMTVSADGKMICTDPGAGILQPGWHGFGPQPSRPPPPRDPPCPDRTREDCIDDCNVQKVRCENVARNTHFQRTRHCRDLDDPAGCFSISEGGVVEYPCKSIAECLEQADEMRERMLEQCEVNYHACLAACARCEESCPKCGLPPEEDGGGPVLVPLRQSLALRALAVAANQPGTVEDQIAQLLAEFDRIFLPFEDSRDPLPPAVQNQLKSLVQQIEALAGGDSASYFRNKIIAMEEENATYARSIGLEPEDLDPSNEPPYPVLYLATIIRPGELFTLRGETGPFGQYALFIPRDGILASVEFYDPKTRRYGMVAQNQSPNARYLLPRFLLSALPEEEPDADRDGLPDVVEDIYGTDPAKADSDGDGLFDGAEADQGTNPLDGVPVRTGILATIKTPGTAVDVAGASDRLAVAQGTSGVSLFDIVNGLNPTLAAHFPAVGNAQRAAVAGRFVAVASGDDGVPIIDADAPGAPTVVRTYPRAGAQAIAADGGVAYAGFASGAIVALDLDTGQAVHELSVTNAVVDVALQGDHLYALTESRLFAISLASDGFTVAASIEVPSQNTPKRRVFAGGGMAWTVHGNGYNTIDAADPAHPILLATGNTTQFGWRHLVANGSGTGVAAVGPNSVGEADVALYDLRDPRKNNVFLTQLPTPGVANAVALFNGLAYVADGAAGLQVVNYLPFDQQKVPPSIALGTSAAAAGAEAGGPLRVTASAVDDVQVRLVEFYVDGQNAFRDGSFPFEYRFKLPALTAAKTNVTLRARAVDTGGNFTWSETVTIALLPDATPPQVIAAAPRGGAKVVTRLIAYFSEPMNPGTLNASSFRVTGAGPDGLFETEDDRPAEGGEASYEAASKSPSLSFPAPLPDGLYRAVVTTAATDTTGNRLAADYVWTFRVADAVFWSSRISGSWSDGANWSTGTVPGPNDEVRLENLPGSITVSHTMGSTLVRNLTVDLPLEILGNSVLQSAGVIELRAPLTLRNGTLRGSTLVQAGGGHLLFAPNAANILDGMRITGDPVITNTSANILVRNGLTVEGTFLLNDASLVFGGSQTFHAGQILFAGNSAALNLDPGTTLTLGPAAVVRGKSGHISASSSPTVKLVNQGRIASDRPGGTLFINLSQFENAGILSAAEGASVTIVAGNSLNTGTIEVQPGGTFTWNGSWTNQGTLRPNEATLNLGGSFTLARLGTVVRTGGTLNVTGTLELGGETLALNAATGPWRLVSGGTIRGGTVTQNAEARLILPANGAGVLDALRVTGDLVITNTSARAIIRNGLQLTGTVILDNTGTITFAGNQTFNTGQILFAGTPGILSLEPGTTLTLGPDMVVRGKSGNIFASAFGTVKLINQGLIAADVPGGTLNINPTQFENPGTLRADGAGAIVRILTSPFANTGVLQESNGGRIVIGP